MTEPTSSLTATKWIWSFGIFKTTALSTIPFVIAIVAAIALQPGIVVGFRLSAGLVIAVLCLLWVRILFLPVLRLHQDSGSGSIVCTMWGLIPIRSKQFDLIAIVTTEPRIQLQTGAETHRSFLLMAEAGPRHWRLGGSLSEDRVHQLSVALQRSDPADLRTLD
jgi:hypothetical protein